MLEKYTQLGNDLVLGDKFEVSIDNYSGEIDHWTAEYENNGTYALPSFVSPQGNDKTKATWNVNDLDMEAVPASSYITF